jgi:hypothetical protein
MEQRLAQALVEAQVAEAEVVREPVESAEEAARLGFRGSPTVLIDGNDPFAAEKDLIGLACRVYRVYESGRGASHRRLTNLKAPARGAGLMQEVTGGLDLPPQLSM